MPSAGPWRELLNTDAVEFGGSGMVLTEPLEAFPADAHGQRQSIVTTLPPLAAVMYVAEEYEE